MNWGCISNNTKPYCITHINAAALVDTHNYLYFFLSDRHTVIWLISPVSHEMVVGGDFNDISRIMFDILDSMIFVHR